MESMLRSWNFNLALNDSRNLRSELKNKTNLETCIRSKDLHIYIDFAWVVHCVLK